ncbi:hypothetical protein Pmani_012503 [Petrolisthes manimaculis]|uniref:non-specific serine/threonine protein kinase n=1 Tax=Petrolisthes manimaculis TaxID=1843537 RepID=A0AAE1PZ53_9EUCA|nr:hypothetical protein Pmani_012503 [Petrolisthes manimaculis]
MPTCKRCREQYTGVVEGGKKEPLQLECGHTFCRGCLVSQESAGPVRCHICKRKHTWPLVKDLKVNKDMLSAVPQASSPSPSAAAAGGGNGVREHDQHTLLEAAIEGEVEVALKLIWRGVSADTVSTLQQHQGRRPLHLASDRGHENLVWVLLRAGAMVDARDQTDMTALHLAAWSGNLGVVTILIMHGADPLLQVKGRSAFHLAAEGGHVGVLRELKHRRPQDLQLPTADYKTPLHLAADNGNLTAVKWLLEEGADPEAKDAMGLTPLDCARQEHQSAVVDYLISASVSSSRAHRRVTTSISDSDSDEQEDTFSIYSSRHVYEELKHVPKERRAVSEACLDMRGGKKDLAEGIQGMRLGRAMSQKVLPTLPTEDSKKVQKMARSDKEYQVVQHRGGAGDEDNDQDDGTLGDYVVLKRLQKADFGETYLVKRAEGTQVMRRVNLEEVPARTRSGLLKEVMLLRQISHPHIVDTMGGGTNDGFLYLFTVHCRGGCLTDRIQEAKVSNTPFMETQILTWSVSLAQALAYLHNREIMHRDVKPDNLLLGDDGSLKLGNFSFARFVQGEMASSYIGTPVYMSPQILQGGLYDTKADMWSMGCCLYEMATLQRGYPYTQVKVNGKYGKKFKGIVKDLLNRDPAKRPSATEILARPVFKATLEEKVIREQQTDEVRKESLYSI